MRQKHMESSLQEFCMTTTMMLNGELPPSSMFCVPDSLQGTRRFTPAGDVIAGMCISIW